MKKYFLALVALLVCGFSFAQGEMDAGKMASRDLNGSARGQAMGGAFGALGGDITGVMINPAGLAVYRSAELTISAGLDYNTIKANWNGVSNKDNKTTFDLTNASYVYYVPIQEYGVESINFGLNYNRAKSFNSSLSAKGGAMNTSLTDYIADASSGFSTGKLEHDSGYDPYSYSPWLSVLGYNMGIIEKDPVNGEGYYRPTGLGIGETVSPRMNIIEKGRVDNYDFSGGININHQFYVGLTVSLTEIDYTVESSYRETYGNGDSYAIDNYLNSEGYGVQVKVGAIWRPVNFFRLGVAYHTPVYYSMTDYYQARGESQINGWGSYDETPHSSYQYEFQSPYTWTFSGAFVLGSNAVVSADWEIKDYSSMKLKERHGGNLSGNAFIEEDYRVASTVRLGAEYRFMPQLSGRIGYAWMQNPYTTDIREGNVGAVVVGTIPHYVLEGNANYYTAGLGYRFTPQFSIDLAYIHKTQTDKLYAFPMLYDENGDLYLASTPAELKNNASRILVTLGYKF